MDTFFEKASEAMGGNPSPDQLKVVASILSAYPCAALFRLIPDKNIQLKHLYSISITSYIMLSFLHYYKGMIHITGSCLFTYVFMKYYRNKNGPWINFFITMVSMSVCHLIRQFQGFNTDNVDDYSGVMMLLTIKLISFGFNVLDGRTDQTKLSGYNKRMMVTEYPTPVEYFGWIFFFGGFLVGPSSEYMDYKRFITMQVFDVKGNSRVPSPFKATLLLLGKSLLFMAVIAFLSPYFNSPTIDSDTWRQLSFMRKIFYMQVAAFTSRSKYYVAWFLSEGASVLSGFGFNGYDKEGNVRWDRFTNIYVKKCELSQSIKEILDNWNISANRWLRYYVYARVTPPNQTGGAKSTLITYGVSALWHGFYPGYYMFFLSITPFQMLARQIRRTFRPFVMDPITKEAIFPLKFIYDCGGVVITMVIVNILSAAFNLLYWTPAITSWKHIYFVHYLLLIAGNIFINVTSGPLRKMQKAREEKALRARPVEFPVTPPAEKDDETKILKSQ